MEKIINFLSQIDTIWYLLFLIIVNLISIFTKSYLFQKGKNLATKEDIAKITSITEEIKNKYNLAYSITKDAKIRYNSRQFELYNKLWSSLIDLEISADKLWNMAVYQNLKEFTIKLKNAKTSILKSSLLINNEHYKKLMDIIKEFEEFKIGKTKLIDFKSNQTIDDEDIKTMVQYNKQIKKNYNNLLKELKMQFQKTIYGDDIEN